MSKERDESRAATAHMNPAATAERADVAAPEASDKSEIESKSPAPASTSRSRGRKLASEATTMAVGIDSPPETKGEISPKGRSSRRPPEPDRPVTPDVTRAIEAILLSTDKAVSAVRLSAAIAMLENPTHAEHSSEITSGETRRIRQAIESLNAQYAETGRVFRIEALAGGYRVLTVPEVGHVLKAFHGARERASLSRAALESLAIIAYKQPLTRAKLEAVRGVACGEILRSLTERRLVTVVGRAEELGRPLLYGTTKQFLEAFGLASVKDLPTVEEFKARAGAASDEDED